MSSDTRGGVRGFTVRTVYCCNVCGLEVSDQEKIIQHLAEQHEDAESDTHNVTLNLQQQDDVTSSSAVLHPKKLRQTSKRVSMERSDGQVVSNSKPLVCPKCGRLYKYMRCFNRHVEQAHKIAARLSSVETLSEQQCTASQLFSDTCNSADCEQSEDESRDSSTDDLLNVCDQLELQEVTDILDDVLTSVSEDKQSVEQVDESQMAPYCCVECPKRFQTCSSLRLHISEKHTGWTLVCKWCDQLFIKGSELHTHVIRDHSKDLDGDDTASVEPVLISHCCMICGLCYRSDEALTKHMASHDDSLPAFACSMCSGRYLTKSGLRCHIRQIHSGDYPYPCELCGDRFASAAERSTHVEQHAPDLCKLCGVRLRRQTYGMETEVTTCNVCYLEQLSSRDGLQIAGEAATTKTVAQGSDQTSLLPLKYCCSFCGVKFVWLSNLRRHERKHASQNHCADSADSKARHFQCSYCGRVFSRAGGLRRHILRHVQPSRFQQPSVSCKLCGQRFLQKKSLNRHMRVAHTPSLARHIRVVTSASSVVQCNSTVAGPTPAKEDTVNLDSLGKHDHSRDLAGSPETCTHHYNQQDDRITPSKDETPSEKNRKVPVSCPECGSAFFWRSNLLRHIREQHHGNKTSSRGWSSGVKNLQCNRCGRRFSRLSYLRIHLQAHENADKTGGVRSEACLCSQCGQKMSSARLLRIHTLRHTGVRPHQCELCDKSFFVATELNTHVSVVHRGQRFVCDQCGHEANSRSALKVHCRSVHPAPGVEPSFPCSSCSRRFWSQAALRRHAVAHDMSRLSMRKAMCSVCSLVFRHVYNLTHHIKTTHADVDCATPFACATCRQQFDSGPAFKTHYRSKHRNR